MGATCRDCNQDMLGKGVNTCTHSLIQINGGLQLRDTKYYDFNVRCHDCGILNNPGNVHHYGCDMERCPICGGQLIGCSCDKGDVSLPMPKSPSPVCPTCGK